MELPSRRKTTLAGTVLSVLLCASWAAARSVSPDEARQAATAWIASENLERASRGRTADFAVESVSDWTRDGRRIGYVASLSPPGFILLPAATELAPFQFVAFGARFDGADDHPFLAALQKRVKDAMAGLGYDGTARKMEQPRAWARFDLRKQGKNEAAWERYLTSMGRIVAPESSEVTPLLTTTWDQGSPYSLYTPYHDPTGCTATAMAEVVNRSDFDTFEEWFWMFREQLAEGLPVLLAIYNEQGFAHAVVVDGHRTDRLLDIVHVNMGWAGLHDAYYSPDHVYIGTGTDNDHAMINIMPDTMAPSTWIDGTVLGYDALPIRCVEVQLFKKAPDGTFSMTTTASTDADGYYATIVSPGTYKAYFYAVPFNYSMQCAEPGRKFNSEWYDGQPSYFVEFAKEEAKEVVVARGQHRTIDATLDRECFSVPTCPHWINATDYGNGSYLLMWGASYGSSLYTERYELQQATQPDYSDAVRVYRGMPPPFYWVEGLPGGTYYFRIRGENVSCGSRVEWDHPNAKTLALPVNGCVFIPYVVQKNAP